MRTREELLKDIIEQEVIVHATEELADFSLNHPVSGYLKKTNGENAVLDCVLDVNEDGILAVLISSFRTDKIKAYQYFPFTDIQGIKIKKGILHYHIRLQFKDGKNYVFQVMKRRTKHFPNQVQHLEYMVSVLHGQHLTDMDNHLYQKKVIRDKIFAAIYIVTLLLVEIIALFFSYNYNSNNMFLTIGIVILAAIIHFILCIAVSLYLDKRKDKHFMREYNQFMKRYSETESAEVLLNSLTNMENPPKTTQAANAFSFSMSTALYKTNRKEEALFYLDKIKTPDKEFQKAVEEQKARIKDEMVK